MIGTKRSFTMQFQREGNMIWLTRTQVEALLLKATDNASDKYLLSL